MKLKEAIPGFEPGSPDSKSGVINHYTKSPVISDRSSFIVKYICHILEIFNTSQWYVSDDQFPKLHLSAKLGTMSGYMSVC
jgi:hypothetical protein